MSLIDEKTKEEFCTWAAKNEDKHIFPVISEEEDSYYVDRDSERTYMMDYSFKTVAELKEALEEHGSLLSDSRILRMLVIEICRNRYDGRVEKHKKSDTDELQKEENRTTELPEFVYIF